MKEVLETSVGFVQDMLISVGTLAKGRIWVIFVSGKLPDNSAKVWGCYHLNLYTGLLLLPLIGFPSTK